MRRSGYCSECRTFKFVTPNDSPLSATARRGNAKVMGQCQQCENRSSSPRTTISSLDNGGITFKSLLRGKPK